MILRIFLFLVALFFVHLRAEATAGLAEWQVLTPGGNVIRHQDGWKEDHGDCLTSSEASDATLYVSDLVRWRYFSGLVAGENKEGFFLFDERTKEIKRFERESDLDFHLTETKAGAPLSSWLTGGDAYAEAWFPLLVWKPCKIQSGELELSAEEKAIQTQLDAQRKALAQDPSVIAAAKSRNVPVETILGRSPFEPTFDCKTALSPDRLQLLKITTWGQECRKLGDSRPAPVARASDDVIRRFCRELLGAEIHSKEEGKTPSKK